VRPNWHDRQRLADSGAHETQYSRSVAIWKLIRQTFQRWSDHNATRLAASLAYYTIFSLAPLLVISIALMGLVVDQNNAQTQVVRQIEGLVGKEGGELANAMVKSAASPEAGVVATVVGVITLLIGATGVFGELQSSLNLIWDAKSHAQGVRGIIFTRVLSFAMILVIGFLLLVSLIATAIVSAFSQWLEIVAPGIGILSQLLNFVISFVTTALLFACIFKILPDTHIAWRDVGVGAIVTALLFSIGRLLIGLYLGHSTVSSVYGAAGSLAVLLLWVYYSAQILFLGAEFTQVYATTYGSRRSRTQPQPAS